MYVVDDVSTGCMDNISHLNHPNFFYEIDSIMNERLMERLIQRGGYNFSTSLKNLAKSLISNTPQ